MVVASLVQVRQLEPDVDFYVVALGLQLGGVLFFAGAGDNDEFVGEGAGGVTVAGVAHFVLGEEEADALVDEYFVALVHGLGHFVEVAPAHEEQTAGGHLHRLEVVGEGVGGVNGQLAQVVGLQLVLVDELRVPFEDVEALDQGRGLAADRVWLKFCLDYMFRNLVPKTVPLAFTPALVALQLLEFHGFEAVLALELELQQHGVEEPVHGHLLGDFVANHAFENGFLKVLRVISDFGFREVRKALGAGSRLAAGALEDVFFEEEANGALEVLQTLLQFGAFVVIFP